MPRQKTGGRQKGTPNKINKQAKDAIALAAEALGGYERLTEWARFSAENEKVFWSSIYTKLVPTTVGGDPDGAPIQHKHEVSIELVDVVKPEGNDE